MVVNVIVPYDYTKVPPRKPKNAIEEAEMAAKEPDPTPLDIAKGILDKLGCTTASYRLIVDIDPAERILEYAKTAEADMIVLEFTQSRVIDSIIGKTTWLYVGQALVIRQDRYRFNNTVKSIVRSIPSRIASLFVAVGDRFRIG